MSNADWTRSADVRRKLERRWRSGDLLRAVLDPEALFPLRLALRKPAPGQLTEQFDAVRDWVGHWQRREADGLQLEWRHVNHRQLGRNRLPVAVVFREPDEALREIGQLKTARQYRQYFESITAQFPELADWCRARPLQMLQAGDDWPRLLATLGWMREHPWPGIHIRQLDIPGVHTKFIEGNRRLLAELLDRVLPESAIDAGQRGAGRFEARYGFLTRPHRIRFRILDERCGIAGLTDLEIPAGDFHTLDPDTRRVFIVENDVTALAFPAMASSLVIFGQGYGIGRILADARWLRDRDVFYWGDLDSHGFRILDQLRLVLPGACSLLMDPQTLMANEHLWGFESHPWTGELTRLTESERTAFRMLDTAVPGRHIRLEQEQLPFREIRQV